MTFSWTSVTDTELALLDGRRFQVAALLRLTLTHREIADRLGLASHGTVSNHARSAQAIILRHRRAA